MLQKLVLVRHGRATLYGGHLDEFGKAQMRRLGPRIKEALQDEWATLLSSAAPRARESAEILSEFFLAGIPVEAHDILWSEPGRVVDIEGVLNLLRETSDRTPVVVVVTHEEYIESLQEEMINEWETQPETLFLEKGDAALVDLQKQTIQRL